MQQFLQQLENGIALGAIYALIAVGYTMVYGVLRLINFAHGDVFMVGAVLAYYAATLWFHEPLDSGAARAWHWLLLGALLLALAAGAWFELSRRKLMRTEATGAPRSALFICLGLLAAMTLAYSARRWFRPAVVQSWPGFIGVLLTAMAGAGLLGFLIEFIAYRPLRNQPRINALITAIGVSMLLEFGGQNPHVFGASPRAFPAEIVPKLLPGTTEQPRVVKSWSTAVAEGAGAQPVTLQRRVELIGRAIQIYWDRPVKEDGRVVRAEQQEITIAAIDLMILLITLVLMVVLRVIVQHTKTGLALRAVSYRFDTSALMGINVNRVVSFTFVLGSCLAGAAGVLYVVRYPPVNPLMGLIPGLKAFIAAVLGGIGNVQGAVLGGFMLGVVETLVAGFIPSGSQYKDAIAFAILIVVLLVKPSGLMGRMTVEKV
jgi:branched-chain amino acid transport system permease protein